MSSIPLFDNDDSYDDDRSSTVSIVNFNGEKCSSMFQQLLTDAGINLRINSAQGNESLVVNKLRRPLSHVGLNNVPDNDDTDANSQGYIIPSSSSSISTLQLINSQIKDINVLFHNILFPKLNYLNVSFNAIKDISPPAISLSFANVLLLDISHNRINSLDFVSQLTKLQCLRCHYNQIESLSPLQYLNTMEEIWVSNNKIEWTQFIFLSNATQLKKLVKYGNPGDEKSKINEFLVTIIPSLVIVDQDYADRFKNSKQSSTTNDASSVDSGVDLPNMSHQGNKVGTDVRIMITQAKAMLKRDSIASQEDMDHNNDDRKGKGQNKNQRATLAKSPSKKSMRNESSSGKEKPYNAEDGEDISKNPPSSTKAKAAKKGNLAVGKSLASVNADLDSMLEGIKNLNSHV